MNRIGLIFFFLAVFTSSLAQVPPEQLNKLKNQLARAKNDSIRGQTAFELAIGYRFSNVDSSIYYADLALALARKLNALRLQAAVLSLKGATLLEKGKVPESLKCQFDALKISEEIKDTLGKAFVINRIGNTYMELGEYRKANDYYFLSKDLFTSLNNTGMVNNEISNIGNIYELQKMPDSALYYQQIALEASQKNFRPE